MGIFPRRQEQQDGSFSTSAWTIEEKATALAAGKRLLLFVENGVREFGGLQGDYEYIRFERDNLGEALIHAMDYVLAITSIPLACRVEGPNKLHFRIGAKVSPAQQIGELKEFVARHPTNVQARVELAKLIADTQIGLGVAELRKLANEFSNVSQIHHDLAHQLEKLGDVPGALLSFQCALMSKPEIIATTAATESAFIDMRLPFPMPWLNEAAWTKHNGCSDELLSWGSKGAGNSRGFVRC